MMPMAWGEKFHDFGLIHHRMCEHLDPGVNKKTQIYLSAFRGSNKSTQLLGMLCWFFAWGIVRKQTLEIVYNTATKDNAFNMEDDVRHSLLENEHLHWVFPEMPTREEEFSVMTQRRIAMGGVRIDFSSLDTTQVSRHYKIFVNDDWENDTNASTEYMREELKKKWRYQKAILTKIKKKQVGLEYEVGTPYHVNGLCWMIRNMPTYSRLEIPCYVERDKLKGVTYPELYGVEDFEAKRAEMGHAIFSSQFLLLPQAEEDVLCPEGWVRYWKGLPDVRWRTMVIDPGGYGATSGAGKSDATGITICDTDENGTIYIVFADEFFLTPMSLLETIINLKRSYDPDDMRIEKEKFSTTIADIWEHKYPELNVSFVQHQGRSKGDKDRVFNTRIWRLKQWFESKRILLAPHMMAGHPFYDQLVSFPETTSGRVDMMDSLSYQLDIRRIPKRKGNIYLPSGKLFIPNIGPGFDEELDKALKYKRMMEESKYDDDDY